MPPPFPPIEPPATGIEFPDPRDLGESEVVAIGADFRPGTLLSAYRRGVFPWPQGVRGQVPWCSTDPRAIFPLGEEPHWSRSLRRTLRVTSFTRTLDQDFRGVVTSCGDERPKARWIIPPYVEGFCALHGLGWTHSVEVWEGRELVGGIYGVAVGGLFAGESMFHRRTDASKIAFATLVHALRASGFLLFDVQVMNPHLASLGCIEVARADYLDLVEVAVTRGPLPLRLAPAPAADT